MSYLIERRLLLGKLCHYTIMSMLVYITHLNTYQYTLLSTTTKELFYWRRMIKECLSGGCAKLSGNEGLIKGGRNINSTYSAKYHSAYNHRTFARWWPTIMPIKIFDQRQSTLVPNIMVLKVLSESPLHTQ